MPHSRSGAPLFFGDAPRRSSLARLIGGVVDGCSSMCSSPRNGFPDDSISGRSRRTKPRGVAGYELSRRDTRALACMRLQIRRPGPRDRARRRIQSRIASKEVGCPGSGAFRRRTRTTVLLGRQTCAATTASSCSRRSRSVAAVSFAASSAARRAARSSCRASLLGLSPRVKAQSSRHANIRFCGSTGPVVDDRDAAIRTALVQAPQPVAAERPLPHLHRADGLVALWRRHLYRQRVGFANSSRPQGSPNDAHPAKMALEEARAWQFSVVRVGRAAELCRIRRVPLGRGAPQVRPRCQRVPGPPPKLGSLLPSTTRSSHRGRSCPTVRSK